MTKTKSQKQRAKQARAALVQAARSINPNQKLRPKSPKYRQRPSQKRKPSFGMAIARPFDRPMCIPDGSLNRACFTIMGNHQMSTGAGGSCSLVVSFDPLNHFYGDDGTANAGFTYNAANNWVQAPNLAGFQAAFARWRPVSMGIRYKYCGGNNPQGLIGLGQLPPTVVPTTLNGRNAASINTCTSARTTGNITQNYTITWRPEDKQDFDYQNFAPAAGALNLNPCSLPYLFVGITGAAANSAVGFVEYVVNWEGEYISATAQYGRDTQNAMIQTSWFEKAMSTLRFVTPIAMSQPAVQKTISGYFG